MKYTISALFVLAIASASFAQSFTDSFEGATASQAGASGTVTSGANTWDWINNSAGGPGPVSWNIQTNSTVFPAHDGISFLSANFNSATGANNIDNWIFAPVRTLSNGDTFSFYTRVFVNPASWADRLNLMISTNGSSTAFSDFTQVLSVNPNVTSTGYPAEWTEYSYTVTGLNAPISGRFAFNYNVPDGGSAGSNSDFIGIDSVSYQAVPEPATMLVLGLGAAAVAARRRRNK